MFKKRKIDINENLNSTKIHSLVDVTKNMLASSSDIKIRKLIENNDCNIYYAYVNNLVDMQLIDESILRPIATNLDNIKTQEDLKQDILKGEIYHADIIEENNAEKLVNKILNGNFALIMNDIGYVFDVKKFDKRSVSEASNEVSVKGARDAFIEVVATNVALVRKKLITPKLKSLKLEIGEQAKSTIMVMYLDGMVKDEILQNIIYKIKNISIDAMTSPEAFEENLVDNKKSIFPTMSYTERPDKFVANICEGKIGILLDGFPIGYIVPCTFSMLMQDSEEYTTSFFVGTFVRILRYVALIITMIAPAFYIAITVFHNEMIPKKLTVSIAKSKADVPFSVFIEVIIMLLAFEMLIEAGTRLPKNIGQTISILGGLIVGEAAISAKLVSPVVVVIVATTGIASFSIPNQDLTNVLRLVRLRTGCYGKYSRTIWHNNWYYCYNVLFS